MLLQQRCGLCKRFPLNQASLLKLAECEKWCTILGKWGIKSSKYTVFFRFLLKALI